MTKAMAGVYIVRCSKSDQVYIGYSSDIRQRWRDHLFKLRKGIHFNKGLQALWNDHSPSTFSVELIEDDSKILKFREQHWIDHYRSLGQALNTYDLPEARSFPITDEIREARRIRGRASRLLTMEQANDIRRLYGNGPRPLLREIGALYGVSHTVIQGILKGTKYND